MAAIHLNGKEIQLAFTVRAKIEIGKIGGKHSYTEFINSIDGTNDEKDFDKMIEAIRIMNDAYLRAKALENGVPYEADSLEIDRDAFLDMDMNAWDEVQKAIIETITGDSKASVKTEPVKKKGKNGDGS